MGNDRYGSNGWNVHIVEIMAIMVKFWINDDLVEIMELMEIMMN